MANRKQSMIMRDERYVDRRLKIFKVKKKGPIFDVKKIAADLKAKTAKAVESLKERQTNSDLINSIQIKSMMIPPQPPVKRPIESRPTECYTIIDSSEDEVRTRNTHMTTGCEQNHLSLSLISSRMMISRSLATFMSRPCWHPTITIRSTFPSISRVATTLIDRIPCQRWRRPFQRPLIRPPTSRRVLTAQ